MASSTPRDLARYPDADYDHDATQTTPFSSHKKVSLACHSCRRRRTKCDGGVPCAPCFSRNTECIKNENDDGRRKLTIKRRVEALEKDRHFLEDLLRAFRIGGPKQLNALVNIIRADARRHEIMTFLNDGFALKCNTCKTSGRACRYSLRTRRGARSHYCQMREALDEALQQMYWACRRRSGFPGDVPEESTGLVTTDTILRGLGLMGPALEGPTSSQASEQHEYTVKDQDQAQTRQLIITPPAESDSTPKNSTSTSQSTSRPSAGPPSPNETNSNMDMDFHLRSAYMSLHASPYEPIPVAKTLESAANIPRHDSNSDSYLEVHAFLDPSSGTIPTGSTPSGNFAEAMQWYMGSVERMQMSHFQDHQTWQGTMCDSDFGSWSGSLAASYQ